MANYGFKRKAVARGPTQKPIEVREEMHHGQLVKVRVFASPQAVEECEDVRPKGNRGRAK